MGSIHVLYSLDRQMKHICSDVSLSLSVSLFLPGFELPGVKFLSNFMTSPLVPYLAYANLSRALLCERAHSTSLTFCQR